MKKTVAEMLGNYVGEVVRAHDKEEDSGNGRCMRVRVKVDINRPLCLGRKIGLAKGVKGWVSFQYERLPNFCYWCGIPNHGERDYEEWLRTPTPQHEKTPEYGSCLKAIAERTLRKVQVIVEGRTRLASAAQWTMGKPPKSATPSPSSQGTAPPQMESFPVDMEVMKNLEQADIVDSNHISFEERLREIDRELNYGSGNNGIVMPPVLPNQANLVEVVGPLDPYVGLSQTQTTPSVARSPMGDINNKQVSPEQGKKTSVGTWKKKARARGQIVPEPNRIIMAEKRNSEEAFQLEGMEVRQAKTARMFQNEVISVSNELP